MTACARLHGHSVVVCQQCKTPDGFMSCPEHALRVLTPTYPPAAYVQVVPPVRRSVPHLAYSSGYTGSICDACGSLRMRRSGTCETCDDCGNAGGCG